MPRAPLPSALRDFLREESAGGLVLMAAAAFALALSNSPWAGAYFHALETPLAGASLHHWVNDGLMTLFFLLVGLEIKREILRGELTTWNQRILPGVAAAGGMITPAVIYIAFNSEGHALRGWAIPAATDIAFALGVLALLGPRVPVSLKIFLAALAILDDLGAIAIIAIFYASSLSPLFLGAAGAITLILFALNRLRVNALWPYLLLGAALWWCVLHSGVHATLAGVILALAIPLKSAAGGEGTSPLHRLEHRLGPWVAFFIVPLFGFANAGVALGGISAPQIMAPVTIGIALGLFIGKQVGVFALSWLAIRLKLAELPAGATWAQFYGVCVLCGVGFTMSLFIGALAFTDAALQTQVKLGVLAGSLASGAAGFALLRLQAKPASTN